MCTQTALNVTARLHKPIKVLHQKTL